MKKLFIYLILLTSIFNNTFAYYPNYSYKATDWFSRHLSNQDASMHDLFEDYCLCRVQEIDYAVRLERNDISQIEYEIAKMGFDYCIIRKKQLSDIINSRSSVLFALTSLRNEANKIANEKFTTEILSSLFVQYKTGKRAAAKIAKRDFYFECYKILKNRNSFNYYRRKY